MRTHLQRALEAGATEQEISEMIGVTLLISGGSSVMWAWPAINEVVGRQPGASSGGCCTPAGGASPAVPQEAGKGNSSPGSCCS
ncbi:MAG: carboxymuconolactone decarboxylase family protein [Candidatus Tectomicrobia bacterium]|uniref:Carboxymuconolactone decarboxylase family protein n=1 Tax=Tectimicrobiota bacterium TaxID=2528274 RepID=A0A932CPP0_UNCTE|nr:carboxymuconolactone decarboxylase family protein [Candidatus Tectomicrobia bacterium]